MGRSAAAKELDARAVDLAVGAWVRHHHTNYDELLAQGCGRGEACMLTREKIDQVLDRWRKPGASRAK